MSDARSHPPEAPLTTRRHFAFALVFLLAWFGSLELRGLFIPDEARYAEIPREMLASGDWTTPRLNGLKYFEKPPLQYWLTASSFAVFGEDEWTARLPAALLGLLALLMVGYCAARLWGARAGALAAVILGSAWGYFLAGQYLTLDMGLTAFLAIALCAFLLAQSSSEAPEQRAWMLLAWLAAALAVLCKGLVGVVLPGAALCAYVLLRRDRTVLTRLHPLAGGVLFLVVAAPWFLAVQARNPEFFDFFFVHEHFRRFSEPGHHRSGAWWYYLPVLIAGTMPWTPAFLSEGLAWLRSGSGRGTHFSPLLFCLVWCAVIVFFFSFSESKLPAYILPVLPALALLLARRLRLRGPAGLKWSALGALICGGALLAALPGLARHGRLAELGAEGAAQLPWLYASAAALALSGLAAWVSLRRHRHFAPVVWLALGSFGFWLPIFGFLHALDARFSSERLIEGLVNRNRPFHPELPFYSVAQFDHSVPFYLGRTLTLVKTRGELAPGIAAEPDKAIASLEQFEREWQARPGQAFAIMRHETLANLGARGLAHHSVAADERLVIIARRAYPSGEAAAEPGAPAPP